jgi:hypothetical protein
VNANSCGAQNSRSEPNSFSRPLPQHGRLSFQFPETRPAESMSCPPHHPKNNTAASTASIRTSRRYTRPSLLFLMSSACRFVMMGPTRWCICDVRGYRSGRSDLGDGMLRVSILVALCLIGFDRVSWAEEPNQHLLARVADQASLKRPASPNRPRHGSASRRPYASYEHPAPGYEFPAACEALIFPRSPLCAGRPATFGPYAPFPWNFFWYH